MPDQPERDQGSSLDGISPRGKAGWEVPAIVGGLVRETGASLNRAYEFLVLVYLVSLLYLYPYGFAVSSDVNFRAPDIVALVTLSLGCGAILLKGQIRVDRVFFAVVGAFLLLELFVPIVGAVGYRHPTDAVSTLRMAMLWLPMIFLTMLAGPLASLRFERRLAGVLAATLWLNLIYASMQVAAAVGFLPKALLVTEWLQPWALDEHFSAVTGLRPTGFFVGTTALSIFGIVCLCFFYARYLSGQARRDLFYTLLSTVIIVVTTSRAAYAASAAILFAGWLRVSAGSKAAILAILIACAAPLLWLIDRTIGLSEAFYRFSRIAESGLLEDQSFGARVYDIWPTALAAARDYTFGTLVQTPRALPLVDSGYLTYYLQGKWVFIAALAVMLAGQWFLGLRALLGGSAQRIGVMTLFLAIYLTAALVITNPLRSPLLIIFTVFAFWRLSAERRSHKAWPIAYSRPLAGW